MGLPSLDEVNGEWQSADMSNEPQDPSGQAPQMPAGQGETQAVPDRTVQTPPISAETGLSPAFSARVPEGDDRTRLVCDHCQHVQYVNPKIVAGAVVHVDGRILLCRRAIEPRLGYWTLPAGYLELRESPEEGARREAREEACADIEIDALLAVYHVRRISQIQLIYRARLVSGFAAGPESLEVGLFEWQEIPWSDLAFPTVMWALNHYREAPTEQIFQPFVNPAEDPLFTNP